MNKTAQLLFNIHSHAEIVYEENPDQIVYREKDIIDLLVSLGHEAPVWEESRMETVTAEYKRLKLEGFYNKKRNGL